MTRLGVVVPCRDEERVLERKLANLARARWPADERGRVGPHRLLVVDDGSRDATRERACALLAALFPAGGPVQAELVPNALRPGKSGAVTSALSRLGDGVELVVLTDADVVLEPDALVELARAFAVEPRLGVACGAQRFVRDLAADGGPRAADGGPPRAAGDFFDRWSARVRALESRAGRLFSTHGQLLAWRAGLGLAPQSGVAADDIDLALQARARGLHVCLVPTARFLEVKTPRGPAAEEQGLRRARAYLALVRGPRPVGGDALDRLQWSLYARLPRIAPELSLALVAALGLAAWLVGGVPLVALLLAALLAAALAPGGRRALELLAWIRRARREVDGAGGASDAWEMQRS